jgi:hypothetical protein
MLDCPEETPDAKTLATLLLAERVLRAGVTSAT